LLPFVPVVLAAASMRIVSLAPALTEDLFALGAGPQVVAVDAFSNRPPAARRLPRVGGMRDVNAEAVLAERPDVVVGVPYETPSLADLARAGLRTVALPLDGLDDDLRAIGTLGRLTGRPAAAQRLVASIRGRLARTHARAAARRPLRVFVSLGSMGTAGGGSYVDDLLTLANLANVAHDIHRPWVTYSAEQLVAAQPDVLVVPEPGPPLVGEPWDRLAAVRAGRVVRIPQDDLLRPGPRVADVLDDLVAGVAAWR
jgi:iron complex transport system substrate-binding protein